MPLTQIDRDALGILQVLDEAPRDEYVDRNDVATRSGLTPERVNDAVALLVDSGWAEWEQTFGTAPFDFNCVMITARGRYERQRQVAMAATEQTTASQPAAGGPPFELSASPMSSILPPAPVGSPYGFTDEDWETVADRRGTPGRLYVVFGHQFESDCYETVALRQNVETMFRQAVEHYCAIPGRGAISLDYRNLHAGYGEHLFNEIARDIIGADIAVFDTSDLNPNVMLEMGVALTWGVRVLPIKRRDRPAPPSDVSGQTWVNYLDSAAAFVDPEHQSKLVRMVERAIQKKGRSAV